MSFENPWSSHEKATPNSSRTERVDPFGFSSPVGLSEQADPFGLPSPFGSNEPLSWEQHTVDRTPTVTQTQHWDQFSSAEMGYGYAAPQYDPFSGEMPSAEISRTTSSYPDSFGSDPFGPNPFGGYGEVATVSPVESGGSSRLAEVGRNAGDVLRSKFDSLSPRQQEIARNIGDVAMGGLRGAMQEVAAPYIDNNGDIKKLKVARDLMRPKKSAIKAGMRAVSGLKSGAISAYDAQGHAGPSGATIAGAGQQVYSFMKSHRAH